MSIRARILLTFAAVLLLVIGAVMLLTLHQSGAIRRAARRLVYNIERLEEVTLDAGRSVSAIVEQTLQRGRADYVTHVADTLDAAYDRQRRHSQATATAARLFRFVTSPPAAAERLRSDLEEEARAVMALTGLTDIMIVNRRGQPLMHARAREPYTPPVPVMVWLGDVESARPGTPVLSLYPAGDIRDPTGNSTVAMLGVSAMVTSGADREDQPGMALGYIHQAMPLSHFVRAALHGDRRDGRHIIITDPEGRQQARIPDRPTDERFNPAVARQNGMLVDSRPILDGALTLHVLTPQHAMTDGTGIVPALNRVMRENAARVRDNADQTARTVTLLQRRLVLIGTVSLLLSGLAAFGTAQGVLRPLTALRRWTRHVADGDIDAAIPATGPTELNALAADIDTMRKSIQSRVAELTTATQHNQEALRQSEQMLKAVVEQSTIAILRCGLDGRILDSNPAARTLLDRSADTLKQLALRDLMSPHEWESESETIRTLLDRRVAGSRFQKRLLRADGSFIEADIVLSAIRDAGGNPVFVTVAIADITEQVEAQRALHESETEFRQLFTQMLSGCAEHEIIVDADGKPVNYRFLKVNPAFERLTGWKADDVVGKTILEVEPDIEPVWIERYGHVALTGEPITFDQVSEALGKHFAVSAYSPRKGRFAVIFRDVTAERCAAEQQRMADLQLQQAQKLESLGVLAGGIAHDFNNLLMAILGNADLALTEIPAGHPGHRELEEIESASRRASELCRQMLAYAGKGRLKPEPLNICDLIRDMAGMLQVSVSKTVILHDELDPATPPIKADATQLRQVVLNLVTNASEAIGSRSGMIRIRTGAQACTAEDLEQAVATETIPLPGLYSYVEVRDTGEGMDAETCRRVCEPFFTTRFTGRGLGMSAVLGIVRSHNGALIIRSRPGHGTVVRALFPALAPDAIAAGPGRMRPRQRPAQPHKGLILLVDDDESIRAIGKRMLERNGFSVLLAHDGREAVERFTERQADIRCVVMDLTMPHMNGNEAMQAMRAIRKDVIVILSSGYNEEEFNAQYDGARPDEFIQKPYRAEQLLACIDAALESA